MKSAERQAEFGPQLLLLQTNDGISDIARQSGAIYFKNFIRKNWASDDGSCGLISAPDRQEIKAQVVDVMIRVRRNASFGLVLFGCDWLMNGSVDPGTQLWCAVGRFQSGSKIS